MYNLGLKLWSINTDNYFEQAVKLYLSGLYDYIELYVVPGSLNTLDKWKELLYFTPHPDPPPQGGRGEGQILKEKIKFFNSSNIYSLSPLEGKYQNNIYSSSPLEGEYQSNIYSPSPLEGEGRGGGYSDNFKKASHFYSKEALDRAKELRKNLTTPEQILWNFIRKKQLNGMRFRRQVPIGSYIADFVCHEKKLIIELDVAGHLDEQQLLHDKIRDKFLIKSGFKVLRIFNNEIYNNIEGVIDYILSNTEDAMLQAPLRIPFIIHNAHFAQGFNLAKREKEKSNIEIYEETKKFADELGAKYIIFHGGIDGSIEETTRQLAAFNEERALIENKPFEAIPNRMGGKFCRGYSPEEIQTVIDKAKCGFCLDFGHAVCSSASQKFDPYLYIQQFMNFNPKMFHLTDNINMTSPFDSHLHLGKGQLNFDKIKQFLPDNAIITLETDKDSKENIDDFILDVEFMRKLQNGF